MTGVCLAIVRYSAATAMAIVTIVRYLAAMAMTPTVSVQAGSFCIFANFYCSSIKIYPNIYFEHHYELQVCTTSINLYFTRAFIVISAHKPFNNQVILGTEDLHWQTLHAMDEFKSFNLTDGPMMTLSACTDDVLQEIGWQR